MKTLPIRISAIKTGDIFCEDVAGQILRCVALDDVVEDELGWTVRASTPLGSRDFFEARGGVRLRLFIET